MRNWILILALAGIGYAGWQGKLPGMKKGPKVPLEGVFETESQLIRGAVERVELRKDGAYVQTIVENGKVLKSADGRYDYDGEMGAITLGDQEFLMKMDGQDLRVAGKGGLTGAVWERVYSPVRR